MDLQTRPPVLRSWCIENLPHVEKVASERIEINTHDTVGVLLEVPEVPPHLTIRGSMPRPKHGFENSYKCSISTNNPMI